MLKTRCRSDKNHRRGRWNYRMSL